MKMNWIELQLIAVGKKVHRDTWKYSRRYWKVASVGRINFSKCIQYISFFFLLYYIFFWDTRFISSSVILFGLLVFSALNIVAHQKVRISTPAKGFFVVLVCTLFGIIGAGEAYATRICLQMLVCFVVFIAFSFGNLSYENVIRAFIVLCSFYCVGIFLQTISPALVESVNRFILYSSAYSSYKELSSYSYYTGFSGFNIMSALFACLLSGIYLSKLLLTKKSLIKRILYVSMVLLGISATVIAQKRGVFVACAVSTIIMVLITFANKKNVKKFILAILLLLILFAGIYYFLQTTEAGVQFIRRFTESDDISSGRFNVFSFLISESENTFLLGKGTGASQALINMGAHNIYIQIYFDHGIIGLVIYLAWFIFNLRYTVNLFRNSTNMPAVISMLFISLYVQILFLIYGFFGNPINDIYIFLLYIFFTAMSCAIQSEFFKNKVQ